MIMIECCKYTDATTSINWLNILFRNAMVEGGKKDSTIWLYCIGTETFFLLLNSC